VIAARSPSVNCSFDVARTCRLLQRSRSGVYWARTGPMRASNPAHKRGPKTAWSDGDLLERIRAGLAASLFVGEGQRKVWARLRAAHVRTSQRRVLRLMREANLLAPTRAHRVIGPRVHDGTIMTDEPNVRWGSDATSVWTENEGVVTVFAAIDHCTAECVGSQAAKRATVRGPCMAVPSPGNAEWGTGDVRIPR
jgi:putative transposase